MSEIVVKNYGEGARRTGVTTSTPEVVDLSAYVNRYVKIWGDQDFRFCFSRLATGVTFDTAATDKNAGTGAIAANATAQVAIGDPVAAGFSGRNVFVDPNRKHLWVVAISATAQIDVIPTSDKANA